ncbi:MAG: response regulator [Chloroherpetonaceae bacterium]|nr:response regulator [Chloroherpetonaceae bacterium]
MCEMKGEKLSVLFVDDEPYILESLRELFGKKYTVYTANSGEEAIEIVRQHPIAIVMSDQRMPGMKGVEVLRAVRECSPQTIRILLTGFADVDAILDSVNVGEVFRYVRKPWDVENLMSVLSLAETTYLNKVKASQSLGNQQTSKVDMSKGEQVRRSSLPASVLQELRRQREAEESFFQKVSEKLKAGVSPDKLLEGTTGRVRVLVVDDEPSVLTALSEMLGDEYEVLTSRTADEALAILHQDIFIGSLISDQRMPSKTGTDLLIEVSRLAPLLPKILITAYTDVEDVVRLINEGQIHRYIQKPWDSRKLKATIAEAIELYKERLSAYLAERERLGEALFLPEISEATPAPEPEKADIKASHSELANKLKALSEVRKNKGG